MNDFLSRYNLGYPARSNTMGNISETSNQKTVAAVVGKNTALGDGVFGIATGAGRGVVGTSDDLTGVTSISTTCRCRWLLHFGSGH